MNTQTFKDEVRIESSDYDAVVRSLCGSFKIGDIPSNIYTAASNYVQTKERDTLYYNRTYISNTGSVTHTENLYPNKKLTSTEQYSTELFPYMEAALLLEKKGGVRIGMNTSSSTNLTGTWADLYGTWINLYGDVYIHCNDRNDGYGNVSCLHFKNDGVAIEAKGYVNCGMAVHETNEGYELKNSYVAITEKESYTQYVERVYPNKKFSSYEERYNHSNIILNAVVDNNGDATIHVGVGNGSDKTTTSTTIFHGKAQCPTAPTADADLVNKKYAEEHNSLWKDLKTKDFLYGSYFRMIVGPYYIAEGRMAQTNGTVIEEGTVYGLIPNASRTATTGWQKIIDDTAFPLTSSVADYKKLLLVFSDEVINENLDKDVQLFFQEIDVDKYIYLYKIYNERDDLYTKVSTLTKGNKITVNIDGTDITYDYSVYRGANRNYSHIMYMYPNGTSINNNETLECHKPSFMYNTEYLTSLKFYSISFSEECLVAVIGLK